MSTDNRLQTLVNRFEATGHRVKKYGGYYATTAAAREDKSASLLFGENSAGKVWLKDLAGSSTAEDNLRALGLDPATMQATEAPTITPRRQPKSDRLNFQRIATYHYTDRDGRPVYRVDRKEATDPQGQRVKEFFQYHRAGDGWKPGRGDTPELLYNLPQVGPAEVVYLVEGEKDADNLRALGFVATTHAGGANAVTGKGGRAGAILKAYRRYLKGKTVILLPDNDDPGRGMADRLARELSPVATVKQVDPANWGGHKADVSDLIKRLRSELLSNEEIKGSLAALFAQAAPVSLGTVNQSTVPNPRPPAIAEARAAALAEGAARKAAKVQAREARTAELDRRYTAGDGIAFIGDEEIDPDQVEHMRARFTNAKKWMAYCEKHWPDLDPQAQYKIKLAENREARTAACGEYRKMVLPNGRIGTFRWTCGECDDCQKKAIACYRRALNDIQGLPTFTGHRLPLATLEADDLGHDDDDAPRENAPPLPQVHGDLSLVTVDSEAGRLALARELRRDGISYKAFPILKDGGISYDFIINDDRGDPLGIWATDDRLKLWVLGVEGKRTGGPSEKRAKNWDGNGIKPAGSLLPCLKDLQTRYRQALPFEVVMPALDDAGQPVDPDIFALEVASIGTAEKLPAVILPEPVTTIEELQAALTEIHEQQVKRLARRGIASNSAYRTIKFYTRYSTSDRLIASFNRQQDSLRAEKAARSVKN